MADLNYDVSVNTSSAERNLANLQKSVGGINTAFLRFKQTIATISLGAVITQALQYADAISDLCDASGIAVGNILGFSAAVQANGGSAEGAQKAILKLVNAIGDAADGSEETQKQFKAVGVSLNDLRTLSEQQILQKTIEGLDKITDNGKRSIAVTALLGKEFRNVAAGGLAQAYADATAQSAKYSDAITKGAAAQQNIDKTLTDFKTGLLEAIKPLTELISKVNIGVENFQKFVQALLAIGAALLIVAAGAKVWAILKLVGVALAGIYTTAKASAVAVGGFMAIARAVITDLAALSTYSARWQGIKIVIQGITNVIASALAPAFTALKGLALPILASIAGYWGWIQDSTGGAINKIKEYLNYLPGVNFDIGGGQGRGDPKEIANREAAEKAAKAAEEERRSVRDKAAEREMDRYRKLQAALTAQQQTYIQLNSEAQTFSNYLLGDLKFQTSLLGMTEDQKEIATALNNETNRYLQQQNQLQSKLSDVQSQIGIELKAQKSLKDDELAASKDKVSLLVEEESKLKELSKTYYDLHLTNGKNLESELKQQQNIKNTEAERLSNLEYISERLREQAASYENLGGALRSINDKRVDLRFEGSLKGLSPLRAQITKINEEARKAAMEAGRSLSAGFDNEDGLTPERARELTNGLDAIAQGYRSIADEQIKSLGVSAEYLAGFVSITDDSLRSLAEFREEFKLGTKDAFEKFKEDANDAGKQAANSFGNFTSGMEDAFVEFAKTGKLSFKSLADSIIADLIRIAVRRAIVAAIGGPLGSLFGMANGGSAMAGTPYMVGERGPELFVPSSAGKIVPNNVLSGSAAGQGAVNGGGQTVVNYNIQAVDASSFRSLVAKDPSFIYAVTEQGRRSQPTRTR